MTTTTLQYLRPSELIPWPGLNPRRHFDEGALAELTASVREKGVLQPLLVHRGYTHEGPLWIVAGETRWRAATAAGVDRVPCMVREYTDAEALEVALLENVQRKDLTVLEEARGYQRWLDTAGGTQAELAQKMGIAQPTLANKIRLLALPDDVLALIDEGLLVPAHARDCLLAFTKLRDATVRAKVFADFVAAVREYPRLHASADQVRRAIGRAADAHSRPIAGHGWTKDPPRFDAKLHADCGCGGPEYEYNHAKEVRCFDPKWWAAAQKEAKQRAAEAERRRAEKLARTGGAAAVEMTTDAFAAKYRYDEHVLVDTVERDHSAHARPVLMDPAELAGAALVRVTEGYRKGLHCVDVDAIKRAKSAATRERNRLLKERKAERAERYRAEAAKVTIEPWMLAELLSVRPQNDQLLDVGREMGIDMGKHGEVRGKLEDMPADQVTLLFKTLALRSKNGELSWDDPLEKAVDDELMQRYLPELRALEQRALEAIEEAATADAEQPKQPGARARRRAKREAAHV